MKAKTTILLGLLCAVLIGAVAYYFLPSAYHNRTVGKKNEYHFEKIKQILKEKPELLKKAVFPEDFYFSTKVMVVVNKKQDSVNDTLSVAMINDLSDNYRIYIKIPFIEWRRRFEIEIDEYFAEHKEENHAVQNLFFLEIEYVKGRGVVSAVVSRDFFVYEDLGHDTPILHRYNRYDANGVELKAGEVSEEVFLGVIKKAQKTIRNFKIKIEQKQEDKK